MLELYTNQSDDTAYLKLFYKNETASEPYHLAMPGCELNCPLRTFLNLTSDLIPSDWPKECGIDSDQSRFMDVILYAAVAILMSLLITLSCGVFLYWRRLRQRRKIFVAAAEELNGQESGHVREM